MKQPSLKMHLSSKHVKEQQFPSFIRKKKLNTDKYFREKLKQAETPPPTISWETDFWKTMENQSQWAKSDTCFCSTVCHLWDWLLPGDFSTDLQLIVSVWSLSESKCCYSLKTHKANRFLWKIYASIKSVMVLQSSSLSVSHIPG